MRVFLVDGFSAPRRASRASAPRHDLHDPPTGKHIPRGKSRPRIGALDRGLWRKLVGHRFEIAANLVAVLKIFHRVMAVGPQPIDAPGEMAQAVRNFSGLCGHRKSALAALLDF